MQNPGKFQKAFLQQLGNYKNFAQLFEFLPDVYFFVKDLQGRYVLVNRTFFEHIGVQHEHEALGQTDFDYFPAELANNYIKDDREVIIKRKKIINRIELVPNDDGTVSWFSTNKIPLFSKEGSVIGLAGAMRNLKKASTYMPPFTEMSSVVDYISRHYATKINIKQLAAMIPLSVSQFEKKFKKVFSVSPTKFIVNARVKVACKHLVQSRDSIKAIAKKTGFYDASSFSRQFKKNMGMLPKQYRNKFNPSNTG
jgi:PAS domain S-box-containing protein